MIQLHGSNSLTKMVDKVKINFDYLESMAGIFLNTEDIQFLKISQDISLDEFAAYLTDGKKYNEIKEFAMQLFPQEINAQQLRTKDVVRFKATESLAEGLEVLDKAWKEISEYSQKESQAKMQDAQANRDAELQLAREDREDWQEHEVLIEQIKSKQKTGMDLIKEGNKGMMQSQKLEADMAMSQEPEQSQMNQIPK